MDGHVETRPNRAPARVLDGVIENARIVTPDEVIDGWVAVEDGTIREIGAGRAPERGHDLGGDLLIPGLIELHTDNLERLDPAGVTVIDPLPSADVADYAHRHGITLNPSAAGVEAPEVLVLAIKPQSLDAAAAGLESFVAGHTLVISILAGKTLANLAARLPETRAFVRAMPNLPASIGRGATAAAASPDVSPAQIATANALLGAVGIVEWLDDEALIDAVTGLSGSGPAYIFLMVEALAEAGLKAGLPPALAARLARATVTGAAALLAESPLPPSTLRENVTSPGGTTAAALNVLMDPAHGLPPLMAEAVAAATRRAGELSG